MLFQRDYTDPDDLQDIDDGPQVRFLPPGGRREWGPVDSWTRADWAWWLGQHDGWTPARVDQYLDIDRYQYGVGFQRHAKEPYTFFYMPVPAAVPLHASKVPNVLYGGAAGGTKSHSTRWDAYRHLLAIPDYSSLLMRRTHGELQRNHTNKAIGECARINDYFQKTVFDLTPSQHLMRVPETRGLLTFGHCQNAGDEETYLGDEYDEFRPDELATFLEQQIIGVAGRLRSVKHGDYGTLRARLVGTTNPGGANTRWIKDWWIDKNVSPAKNPRYRKADYFFIGAKLYDNPYLMDLDGTYSQYEDRLYAHSPLRRRQLLNGDWTVITGQFFEEWDERLHVGVLQIPDGCKIECWVDWGYDPHPGVCHWVACFPNGRLYVFAEWVFRKMIASKVADRIAAMTRTEICTPQSKLRWNRTIADPSMWAKDGHTGESYQETFRRHGVSMIKSDNDRIQGWGRFRHWLARHPEGGAWLMYHPDCVYAIRTIPSLVHDDNDPDDCDTQGEDHAADCFVASTLIATPTGSRQIADLRVNDQVWTRAGARRVRAVFSRGVRRTLHVTLSTGRTLVGTANHPIWIEGKGWTPLSDVSYGDMLRPCIQTTSAASPVVSGDSVVVPFPEDGRSIIKIAIHQITHSVIWNVCRQRIMPLAIHRRAWIVGARCVVSRWLRQAFNGFARMRASLAGVAAHDWITSPISAIGASTSSVRIGMMGAASARVNAAPDITSVPQSPASAAIASNAISLVLHPSGAVPVVVSLAPGLLREVYNLTVDGDEEYFAQGVLVHNCDRYGLMARPTPTTYRYVPLPTIPDSMRALVNAELLKSSLHKVRPFGKVI